MTQSTGERKTCVSIFDSSNLDSVYSRLPAKAQEAMERIPTYLKTWSFKKLERTFSHRFTTRDRIWKIAFWNEYQYALDNDKIMSLTNICRGVCPTDYMYDVIFQNNPLFAWMLYPMPSYENAMMEMLDLSTKRLREILELPIINSKSSIPDHKLIGLQLKVHELVENRVRGIAPQTLNINQKSMNLHVDGKNMEPRNLQNEAGRMSMKDVNLRIRQLQDRIKRLPPDNPGAVPLNKGKSLSDNRKKKIDGEYYEEPVPEVLDIEVEDSSDG